MTHPTRELLPRHAAWNLAGYTLPLIVALFAIPMLIARLGIDRFGTLALAWMVLGYFSLFDLGLGRALTKLIAEKLGSGETAQIPETARTALILMLVFGAAGMVILAASSPWLVRSALKIPLPLEEETLSSFFLLAVSIPVVILTVGLRGVLEAYQKFGVVNVIRAALGAFSFLGPLFVLPFSQSLVPIVAVLLAGRVVALLIHYYFYRATLGSSGVGRFFNGALMRPLLSFGSWMTVSNVVGPLMVYLDRFLIGAVISMSAVAFYVTPYEVVTKLWILPGALGAVLFPAFAMYFSSDRRRVRQLYTMGAKSILIMMLPVCLLIVTFAENSLELWLGTEFAIHSTAVLQWLTVGVLVNSIAQIPFALIQSAGRADLTAKLHLIELPCYLLALWLMLKTFGIAGAAAAWVLRASLDMVILFHVAEHVLVDAEPRRRPATLAGIAMLVLLYVGAILRMDPWAKVFFVVLSCAFFLVGAWRFLLNETERGYVLSVVRRRSAEAPN